MNKGDMLNKIEMLEQQIQYLEQNYMQKSDLFQIKKRVEVLDQENQSIKMMNESLKAQLEDQNEHLLQKSKEIKKLKKSNKLSKTNLTNEGLQR